MNYFLKNSVNLDSFNKLDKILYLKQEKTKQIIKTRINRKLVISNLLIFLLVILLLLHFENVYYLSI